MDVHPDPVVDGQFGGRGEGVVRAGETGVHPDHALTHPGVLSLLSLLSLLSAQLAHFPQIPRVLGEAALRSVGTVPIGDAVAGVDPQAHVVHRLRDDRQRALDGMR